MSNPNPNTPQSDMFSEHPDQVLYRQAQALQKTMTIFSLAQLTISFMTTIYQIGPSPWPKAILVDLVQIGIFIFIAKSLSLEEYESNSNFPSFQKNEIFKILLTEYIFGKVISFWFYGNYGYFGESRFGLVRTFAVYLCLFCIYHNGEFLFVLWCHPQEFGWKSKFKILKKILKFSIGFLIYHSREYMIAMGISYLEFFVEAWLFPNFKSSFSTLFIFIFLPMSLIGLCIRLSAFGTARSNFHHLIRYKQDPQHVLVKHGIYHYERHPGYLGYFTFSVCSQIMIKNVISSISFTIVLWRFFLDRISDEEHTLIYFFGKEYLKYKEETRTNIPFVNDLIEYQLKIRGIPIKENKGE